MVKRTRKTELNKITRREIRKTFGRFFAIFAIIALGVGFFSGLRITTPAIVHTVDTYYKENQLFDYRILSTIGWEESDVEKFRAAEGVRAAEGGWQYDVITENSKGETAVYKIYSMTESVNRVVLTNGRMPETDGECLIDEENRRGYRIGDTITFSAENEEDTLDSFKNREFEIVGYANSVLYINFERGTTSIGNGTVAGFLYMLPEAFDSDVYTELYVKLDSDEEVHSDAYEALLDANRKEWESRTEAVADARYRKLYAEAEEELEDAKQEYEEKKADGEKELADAAKELSDAQKELADAKEELEDAWKELEDGRKELENGRTKLDDAAKALRDGRAELEKGADELAENRKKLEDSEKTLKEAKEELDRGLAPLEEAKAQLDATGAQLSEAAEQLAENKTVLDATHERLEQTRQAIEAGLITDPQIIAMYEQGKAQYEAGLAQYEAGLAQYEQGKAQYDAGLAQYEAGLAQYEQGKAEYETGLKAFTDGKKLYEEGVKKYDESLSAYQSAAQQYETGEAEWRDAKKKYEDGLAEYRDGLAEFEDGLKEYEDGLADYREGKETFDKETADAEEKIADAEEELADFDEPDTFVLERNTNVAYACFGSDSEIVKQIAAVFPVFFILVAGLVCMTTMTRMVEEQRGQIGVLKGLGYSESDILKGFLLYAGSASAAGWLLGYVGGIILFPYVIWFAYQMMYLDLSLRYLVSWKLAGATFAAAMLCSLGTTWISCAGEMRESAASLMRPKAPKPGKRVFLEYIPAIWNHMKFMRKVSIRNIFRYKKRLFMMILGISGCTALLLTGFGIKDSIAGFAPAQFDHIQIADAELVYKNGHGYELPADLAQAAEDLGAEYLAFSGTSWDLFAGNQVKSVNMIAMDSAGDAEPYFRLRTEDGKALPLPAEGEAYVSMSLAQRYGIRPGDHLTFRNEDMKTMVVRAAAVFENHVYNYVIISPETLRKASGETDANSAYIRFPEDTDIYQAQTALAKCKNAVTVSVYKEFRNRLVKMMSSLDYVVLLVIFSAAGLAFIVLYNLTNINIIERIREIATIKVLGFFKREASDYIFRENLILTAMGMVVGLFLGRLLHRFVMSNIVVDMVYFPRRIALRSYLLSVILTFAFAFFVNLVMSVKLDRINMAESLKSVE